MAKLVIILSAAALAAGTAGAAAGHSSPDTQLQAARTATAAYRDVARAKAAGYAALSVSSCMPGVGLHFVNLRLLVDGAVDPSRPEYLLYEPRRGGGYTLVGLEYELFAAGHARPTLFGQAFEGPITENIPGLPRHYALHVWLYRPNPQGLFAPSNPNVRC